MSEDKIFCKGGGCTAKLGPEVLDRILPLLPRKQDKDLLVGYDHADDAAIYRLTEDLAIVQTLDFFPPMVEDPHVFGQIAAANALSDIYAISKVQMGVDYMKRSGLSPEEAVFLGDTLHDAETAHAMGCACLLISGGHQPDATLRTAGVPVLPSLREAGDWILERHTL